MPFLRNKVRDLSSGSFLSVCYASLLIFFNFATSLDFGCWSLSQEMSFMDHCLPISGRGLSPVHCQPCCLSNLCLLKVNMKIISLILSHSLVCSERPAPSAVCSFSVTCLLFSLFFLQGRGQSVLGAMLVYPRGSSGNTTCHLFAHLLVCVI
jgi:hypothetical protein